MACPTVLVVKVSTRGDYASRALLSLALHAEESGPTSVRDIAERTGLPQPYLEQILLALKGAGIVRSKRGVGGGYVLARAPEQISLYDIMKVVDGELIEFSGNFEGRTGRRMQQIWTDLRDSVETQARSITLDTFVTKTGSAMYHI